VHLLHDDSRRNHLRSEGKSHAQSFDWDLIAQRIYDVYEMAMVGLGKVSLSSDTRAWSKFLGR
jgi:phosphatidylinositol alpha-mannosyltransferase